VRLRETEDDYPPMRLAVISSSAVGIVSLLVWSHSWFVASLTCRSINGKARLTPGPVSGSSGTRIGWRAVDWTRWTAESIPASSQRLTRERYWSIGWDDYESSRSTTTVQSCDPFADGHKNTDYDSSFTATIVQSLSSQKHLITIHHFSFIHYLFELRYL